MLSHKFFTCIYVCTDNSKIGYRKRFRVKIDQIPEELRDKDNYDLTTDISISFNDDEQTITICTSGIIEEFTKRLSEQKEKPVKIKSCITESYL